MNLELAPSPGRPWPELSEDDLFRFGGVGRLFGRAALARLKAAHVAVVGVGGVGSWAVEALARSGIGRMTVVDFDEVCVSNVNRQLHALTGTVGRAKVKVMAERIRAISPDIDLRVEERAFDRDTASDVLSADLDFVIDAVDGVANKCALIDHCRSAGIALVVSGSAGGRRDPTRVRVDDLNRAKGDPLLARVRKLLRQRHGWPRDPKKPFGVSCVYSTEEPYFPGADGCVTKSPASREKKPLDCASGFGTASFVTGVYGFFAASVAVHRIAGTSDEGA